MKNKNLLALIALLGLLISGCENRVGSNIESKTEETGMLATLLTDDKCFDERMEKWFIEFNLLQNKGFDMNEANTSAIAIVSRELKTCDEMPAIRTATHEEGTEE